MAKKKMLPTLDEQTTDAVDIVETEQTTVAGDSRVEWVTISVPVYIGNGSEFDKSHLPDRVDTGPRMLPREERLAAKRLIRALDIEGEKLTDGTECSGKRTAAVRWLLQRLAAEL